MPKPVVIEPEPDALLRNVAEGALAALAAITTMFVLCFVALSLLHAGSIGSVSSLAAAVMAMAVGSPVAVGSGSSGSGFIQISLGGSIDALPLGVTLVGTVVLGLLFFRPLRRHARVTGSGLLVRAQSAVTVIAVAFVPLARMAQGSLTVPSSAVSHLGVGGGCSSSGSGGLSGLLGGSGGSGGGLSSLLGGGSGGGLSSMLGGVLSSLTFSAGMGSAVFGSVLWASLVLAVGCLVARPTALPPSISRNPVVRSWRPSVSAVTVVLVVVMGALFVVGTCAAVFVGGAGARAVGAALLAAPNLLLVALGVGAGAPWSASFGRAQSQSQGGLLSSLMGSSQGSCGSSGQAENFRTMFVAGVPLWVPCLLLLTLVLLACGYIAAARTPHAGGAPGRAGSSRHLAVALRLGVVTALVMSAGTFLVEASGQVSFGAFSMQMGGVQANLGGNALLALFLGLLVGGAAGFAGSLLRGTMGPAAGGPRENYAPTARDRSGNVRSARTPVSSSAPRR